MKLYEYIISGMCICSQTKNNYSLLEESSDGTLSFLSQVMAERNNILKPLPG